MHRINTKNRRTAALRYAAYALTLVLSITTTVILLYVAQGYRIDRRSGQVIKSGLLLVDNQPEAAQVYINGQQKDSSTPSRFVLAAGKYELLLARSGYRDWKNQVAIAAESVVEVQYPLLIPTKLAVTKLLESPAPSSISQSLDRKTLLTQLADGTLQLTSLDPKQPRVSNLVVGPEVRRESGSVGQLSVVEWSLNNKHVLLRQTLPSGIEALYSLDTTKPETAVDLTAKFAITAASDPHFVGGDTDAVYGLEVQTLRRYVVKTGTNEVMLERVRSYVPYGDDTILFARAAVDGTTLETGIKKNKDVVVVQRTVNAATGTALLQYGQYEDDQYFAVAPSTEPTLTIYRNPLKKPILSKQLPLKSFKGIQPAQLKLAGGSQFLLARNGSDVLMYNFDELRSYRYTLPVELPAANAVSWLDDYHLLVADVANKNYVVDYDGSNRQELVTPRTGSSVYFANDYKNAYYFTEKDGKVGFDLFSLVVK